MNTIIKIFIVLMAMLFVAEASHFRFGTISWQPTTAPNIIKFSSNFAFRTTFFKSSKTAITIGESISVGTLSYGAGSGIASNSVVLTVTDFDPVNDWFSGSYTVTKTYPLPAAGTSKDYIPIFTDCCRISTLLNNKDGSWNITTRVQIQNSALDQVNSSPVSGMLPIYNVVYGKNNNFKIIASDPNNDPLTFSFSTVYSMTQPAGMTISSNGEVYIKPAAIGLYSTQIYIIDSKGAYIVVDFILNSISEPGVCSSYGTRCTNAGAACTTNSQCVNCDPSIVNTVNNTCIVNTNAPPYFTAPTPDDGKSFRWDVKSTNSFTLNCTSGSSASVSIQSANVPKGIIQSKTTGTLTESIVYKWTPNITDVGSYVMSANCYDTNQLTSTVRSFSIVVPKPSCGTGTETSSGCSCPPGWDPATKCFDCLKGYYGPECKNSTKCINGASNDYINGDGKCSCYNGWTGVLCDTPVSKTCKDLTNSIISSTTSATSYINPTFVSLYVKDQTNVSISYSIPSPLPNLNVYVLVDVNSPSTTVWGYLKSNMGTFVSLFKKFSENTQFGLGYFSDAPTGEFDFQPSLTIGSAIDTGITTYSPSSYLSTTTGNSLDAITTAAESPLGWTTGAYKVIVLITDQDHSSSADIAKFKQTLAKQSIMPIIIGHNNAVLTNWKATMSSTGFGSATESTTGADWTAKANTAFTAALKGIVFREIEESDENVISGVPSTITVNTAALASGTVSSLQIKIPSSTDGLASSPTPRVSAIGYGAIDLRVNYNRKPSATPVGFICDQNSKTTFQLAGTDPDSNILTFAFVTLPSSSVGVVSVGSVAVSNDTLYASNTVFTFTTANKAVISVPSFAFKANDGCLDSDPAIITVTINKVNQAPECKGPISITSKGVGATTPLKFTLGGNDTEDSSSKLFTTFGSFPNVSPTYGYFKNPSNVNITATTQVPIGTEITFIQTNNVASEMTVSFYYVVYDSGNLYSSGCAITLTLIHTNVAPIATGTTPVSVIPLGVAQLNLNATDIDSASVKFTITAVAPGTDAYFYDCGGEPSEDTITVGKVYNSVPVISGKAGLSGLVCYKAAEKNGPSYGSITYTATDIEGLTSLNSFTVKIDIVGDRANWAPNVTKIPDFAVYQESLRTQNPVKYVNGTDDDKSDQGNLIGVISTPPAHGTLVNANGATVTNGKAPLAIYYVPDNGYFGQDSFSYYVYDTFKNASSIATTAITVNRINHAPVIKKESTFSGDSSVTTPRLTTWQVTDPEQDTINCVLSELPNNVNVYNSASSMVPYVANSPLTLYYGVYFYVDPSKTSPRYSSFTSYFTVNCTDVPQFTYPSALSDSYRFTYLYTYINTKPSTTSFLIKLDQDSQVSFTFNGTDLESASNDLSVSILTLPTNGKLYNNGDEITDTSKTYSLSGFTYKPNKGLSDYDTNYLPLDKFNFVVLDGNNLASSPAVGEFTVTPRNPPIYTGLRVINVYQNTRYPLTITGIPGNGGVEVNLKVTGFTSRGILSVSHIMGSEKPIDSPITSYPVDLTGSNSYNLAYMPPLNQYGENFDNITIQLYDRDIYGGYITIIVNVIHVNQPPVITPIGYITNDNSTETLFVNGDFTVNMNINSTATIKFDGSDVDMPEIPLQAIMSNAPLRGTVKTLSGEIITGANQNITKHTDGHYYIVFEPVAGTAFARYATVPLVMKDEYGLYSEPAKVVINVNRVNIPPYVTVEDQYQNYTINVKDIVNLKGIVATDPDSINNNITLVLSIVNSTDLPVLRSVATFNVTSNKCKLEKNYTVATCIDNKDGVQSTVETISVSGFVAGNYRLKIFVNDMGYNAPTEIRSQSILTATGYVNMTIKNPGTTTNKPNKTILSVAIAAAAAAAAIIAAGIWKLVKKAAPPTDAFFGEGMWQGDGVNQNPLYAESANSGVNPLYTAED